MSSSIRLSQFLKDLVTAKILNNWTRSYIVSAVVRRCRNERSSRVVRCFKYAFLRPSRTFLLSATTAAYKSNDGEGPPKPCEINISDEEMQSLVMDFDAVDVLSRETLFCQGCERRVLFDKGTQDVIYCACKNTKPNANSHNGWVPYMEAEDCVVWKKEYKGAGLYAYKVYGRSNDIRAQDFAAVQIDAAYRKVWDDAVADIAVVEDDANGMQNQAVIHWEVLWPRLFSNRDYVYMRRHKAFEVKTACLPHTDGIFNQNAPCGVPVLEERPNVHTKAKLKSMQKELAEKPKGIASLSAASNKVIDNRVYVIISRSCVHPKVPESSKIVRVKEYWSHMVIRTVEGTDKPGTEFVLTYYDEPVVGGMPSSLSSFAAARGLPAFLGKMRRATLQYKAWARDNNKEPLDFEAKVVALPRPSPTKDNKTPSAMPAGAAPRPGFRDQSTQTDINEPDKTEPLDPFPSMLQLVENKMTSENNNQEANKQEDNVTQFTVTKPTAEYKPKMPEAGPKALEGVSVTQSPDKLEMDRKAEGDIEEGGRNKGKDDEKIRKSWYTAAAD